MGHPLSQWGKTSSLVKSAYICSTSCVKFKSIAVFLCLLKLTINEQTRNDASEGGDKANLWPHSIDH